MAFLSPNRRLFSLAQTAWRQTDACLPSRKLCSAKQAPVYSRADCVAPNRRLFSFAQTAWPQTGTCLPSRRLHGAKQAPVYPRVDCVASNRRLFSFAQAGVTQTGACLASRRLECPKQAPVYPCAGLCRGRAVYSGTRPCFPAPVGALFSDTKSRSMVLAKFEVLQP